MNKILTAGIAAVTLMSGALAVATPASAQDWDDYGHGGYDRGDDGGSEVGAAIAGGIVGLVLGSALTSDRYSQPDYEYDTPDYRYVRPPYVYRQTYYSSPSAYGDQGYYGPGYYDSGYGGYPYSDRDDDDD